MRQIFSSQRVETAEGVAALLRDAGIEVRITNGRSYRSRRSGQFSYIGPAGTKNLPTVWVVKADDQVQARQILRNHRLLDTTRRDHPTASYAFDEAAGAAAPTRNWGWRIRIGLLLVIAMVAFVIVLNRPAGNPADPGQAPLAPATPAPAPVPPAAEDGEDGQFRVRIVPAS